MGVASRSEVGRWIKNRSVLINGESVTIDTEISNIKSVVFFPEKQTKGFFMTVSFAVNIELPDSGMTPKQQKIFAEALRREMQSKQCGLKKASYERAYEKAVEKKKIITETVN